LNSQGHHDGRSGAQPAAYSVSGKKSSLPRAQQFAHLSVENEMEFGDMRGFAFILINLQYNCQNLSGMALAQEKEFKLF